MGAFALQEWNIVFSNKMHCAAFELLVMRSSTIAQFISPCHIRSAKLTNNTLQRYMHIYTMHILDTNFLCDFCFILNNLEHI